MNKDEHEALVKQDLKLHPIDSEFTENRTVSGLILPGGLKVVVMNPNVSGVVFALWRDQLQAEAFSVSGTMTFKADVETIKKVVRGRK